MDKTRQEILEKLKKASSNKSLPKEPNFNSPLYPPIKGTLPDAFKAANELINGTTNLFNSEKELFTSLKENIRSRKWEHIYCLEPTIQKKLNAFNIPFISEQKISDKIEIGITGCEFLIARTGSAMVSSAQPGARQLFVYPPVHFIIASNDQIVDSLKTAYTKIFDKYRNNLPSMISLITGPSRTADIEKTLVLGAHGPKELHIFISK
ncbi:MAG: LUD domain-containing protein [Mariniphaga sp.]|nr:LUD domain-containing protein [Mariniphaga sp.]